MSYRHWIARQEGKKIQPLKVWKKSCYTKNSRYYYVTPETNSWVKCIVWATRHSTCSCSGSGSLDELNIEDFINIGYKDYEDQDDF